MSNKKNIVYLIILVFFMELICIYILPTLNHLFTANQFFKINTITGLIHFSFHYSLGHIILFSIFGLILPLVYKKNTYLWSVLICIILTIGRTMSFERFSFLNPNLSDYLRRWVPVILIYPSCLLGMYIHSLIKKKRS
jgi:hypothetical protein